MKSDFVVALKQLAAERGLPEKNVLSAIEDALASAYRRDAIADGQNITVKLDPDSGDVTVNILKTVVDNVINEKAEINQRDARKIVNNAQIGEVITTQSMPHTPGRIAAQTAKQVVMQRLRDAEREIVFQQFEDKEGEVLLVTLQKIEPRHITVDLGRSEAIMPSIEQVPTERYRSNTKMRVLLKSVERTPRGPELIVSRADKLLLRRLFEMEVPEIHNGAVEIEAIAREPGSRSKVAVRARQDGVDPVGSCVGLRGVRIQNIVNELHGERIDVVEWNKEFPVFIANALSPAQVMKVELNADDQTAMAVVPERQLSLAIGREGQNARLAAHLTGWKVDIKSDVEYQVELQERARLAAEAKAAAEAIAAAEAELQAAKAEALAAEAKAAEAVSTEEIPLEPEVAPDDILEDAAVETEEAASAPIAAELYEVEDALDPEPVVAEEEDVSVEPPEIIEEIEPAVAQLEPVDDPSESEDDSALEEVAEITAEPEMAEEPEVAAEPEPMPEAVAPIDEQEDAQTTSLRDLPEDIWQVRRARVRRPVHSDSNAPGRIRFAEDIAGLRGGVTASRRNRRRGPTQGADAPANRGGAKRRKTGRRRR